MALDTNVLVSCLLFGGTPGALLDLWRTGRIRMLMSREMVDELRNILYCRMRQRFLSILKKHPWWDGLQRRQWYSMANMR